MSPSPNETSSGVRRKFHLKEKIGAGAFGEVYLAEQDSGAGFLRPVALKVLNANVSGSKEAARRMRDEARILGRLSHRNIVSVLDLVLLGQRWAVVMDFVPGADLEQVLLALDASKAEFPPAAAIEIGASIFRALDVAYHASDGAGGTLQVVHRDIKPSNVRLTVDGEVKVLDFGVARVEMDTREAQTQAAGWIGTERYMAPERILNEGDEPWGDVYAAGATIVELILGRPLGRTPVLTDRHQPVVEAAMDVVRERMTGPEEVVDTVCDLLERSIHAEPQERPTAQELCDTFSDLCRRLEGESLTQFSRRFLPDVPTVLGTTTEPATGILSEGTAVSAPTLGGASGNTFMPAPEDPPEEEAPNRRPLLFGLLGVAIAVALAVAVLGLVTVAIVASLQFSDMAATPATVAPPADPQVITVEPPPAEPETPSVAPPETVEPVEPVKPAVDTTRTKPTERPPSTTPAATDAKVPPVEPPPSNGPKVDAATFAVQDASSITVTCGDVTRSGTSSVRLRGFPAGSCTVSATYAGQRVSGSIDVQRRRAVRCEASGGALKCGG
ncbi:MAG: protein kinase [Myxococcota bacterium]